MSNKYVTLTLQDNDLTFTVYKDFIDSDKRFLYSKQYDDFLVERIVYSKYNIDCRIFKDNMILFANGFSENIWSLNFCEDKFKPNYVSILKHNEELKCIYYEGSERIETIVCDSRKNASVASERVTKETLNDDVLIEKATEIYKSAIADFSAEYSEIIYREEFDNQFISLLRDDLLENSDMLAQHIKDLNKYIKTFVKAEREFPKLKELFSYDYFVEKYSDLKLKCDDKILRRVIEDVLINCEFKPDIICTKKDLEEDLINTIYFEIANYHKNLEREAIELKRTEIELFKEQYTIEVICERYSELIAKVQDKECFYEKLKSVYSYCFSMETCKEKIIETIENCIKEYLINEAEYFDFISKYCTNEIKIELTPEKKSAFTKFEKGGYELKTSELEEYQLYKQILIEYEQFIYTKSRRLKPSITQMPKWLEFFKQVLDILVKSKIVILINGKYTFNSFENIDMFAKKLKKIYG